jgi:hypothetical protein
MAENKKMHYSSKNNLTLTWRSFNEIYLRKGLNEREFDKVLPLGTPRSWVQILVALKISSSFVCGRIST